MKRGAEFAILTDEISRAWSGMTTRQYKNYKGLKKENLRDNMTDLELVLSMLAEATTTEISRVAKPEGLSENQSVARRGGRIAGEARESIEAEIGHTVLSPSNANDLPGLISGILTDPTDGEA